MSIAVKLALYILIALLHTLNIYKVGFCLCMKSIWRGRGQKYDLSINSPTSEIGQTRVHLQDPQWKHSC